MNTGDGNSEAGCRRTGGMERSVRSGAGAAGGPCPTYGGSARAPAAAGEQGLPRRATEGLLRRAAGLLLLVAPVAAGCGAPGPPGDLAPAERFEWGVERAEAGEWGSAEKALRDFLLQEPLHPMADSAQYLLGEALYQEERYLEAAEAFSRLFVNRPTSDFADDALLGECRSYWALAPDLALDQQYARDAVESCRRLLDLFSPSPLEDEAREILRKARNRLAAKRYRVAKWYYDRGAYQSANIYMEQVLEDYPEADVVPEVLATLFRSYRELGFDAEAREVRRRLLDEYPESASAREIRKEEPPGAS